MFNNCFSKLVPDNVVKYFKAGQVTVDNMAHASNTHSEYVIVTAFPLQAWLHERASMLVIRRGSIFCLVIPFRRVAFLAIRVHIDLSALVILGDE